MKAYEKKTCYTCNQKGHTSKFCPTGQNNYNNNNRPHSYGAAFSAYSPNLNYPYYNQPPLPTSTDAYNPPLQVQTTFPAPVFGKDCYNCGQMGHVSKDCPTGISLLSFYFIEIHSVGSLCYKCGQNGHVLKDCTSSMLFLFLLFST